MYPPSLEYAARHYSGRSARTEAEAAADVSESADGSASRSSRGNRYRKPCGMTLSQAHRDMKTREGMEANNDYGQARRGSSGF